MITKLNNKLRSYTGDELDVLGTCKLSCFKGTDCYDLEFFIINSHSNNFGDPFINLFKFNKMDKKCK